LSNSDIESYVKELELNTKAIKDEVFRICWYMRGGVTSNELFYQYSFEDRQIISEIIKENIEATKKSGIALL
jgi:hypothetical protein